MHFHFSEKGAETRDQSKGTGRENSWTPCAALLLDCGAPESLPSTASISLPVKRE